MDNASYHAGALDHRLKARGGLGGRGNGTQQRGAAYIQEEETDGGEFIGIDQVRHQGRKRRNVRLHLRRQPSGFHHL